MDSRLSIRPAPSPDEEPVPASIDEAAIRRLVHRFYDAVGQDQVLGPIFSRQIAPERWPGHLDNMCAFWSSVLLRTRRYGGRPLPPHLALRELSDLHFERWLVLFRKAAGEAMDEAGAQAVVQRAERIAHSFRMAIAFNRGQNVSSVRPFPAAQRPS